MSGTTAPSSGVELLNQAKKAKTKELKGGLVCEIALRAVVTTNFLNCAAHRTHCSKRVLPMADFADEFADNGGMAGTDEFAGMAGTDEFAANGGMNGLLAALNAHRGEETRVCVVVGVTGDGKSTTGNTLCGRDVFATASGLRSQTRGHALGTYTVNSAPWKCIDTIGFEDSCLPVDEVSKLFGAFADECLDGVDAFLFVVKWGRFKPEHERALDEFVNNAGDGVLKHTLLVFTHCDELNLDAVLASDAAPKALRERWLARLAGVVGIDNEQRLVARARLQTALDGLVGGERYSHEALRAARRRRDAAREEDRAAFRAAVLDWRKKDGPLVVERFGLPVEKDK